MAAAGLLLLGLVVAWGALVLRVKTAKGTIVLENVPADAVVEIDGDRITVTPTVGEPLKIEAPAGKHGLVVRRGDLVLLVESVTLEAGKPFKHKLTARIEPPVLERAGRIDLSPNATQRPAGGPAVKGASSQEPIKNSIGMMLMLIPDGEFLMGSPATDKDADKNEKPQHRVRITRPFYLGVYEVTQAQYKAVMGNNPSYFSANGEGNKSVAGQSTEMYPVENISWLDAVKFCNKLGEMEGRGVFYEIDGENVHVPDWNRPSYRLPTEAEWEYACRANAPTVTRYSFGDDPASMGEFAWYQGNSGGRTHPVGWKRPNDFGLFDMHGNVWEWCWDPYGEGYYQESREDDPRGRLDGAAVRVIRGGCSGVYDLRGWYAGPHQARSAFRWSLPVIRNGSLGFRVARVQSGR